MLLPRACPLAVHLMIVLYTTPHHTTSHHPYEPHHTTPHHTTPHHITTNHNMCLHSHGNRSPHLSLQPAYSQHFLSLNNSIVLHHLFPHSHNTHTIMIVTSFSSSPRLFLSAHAYHLDHLFIPIPFQHAQHSQPPITHNHNNIRHHQN